MQKTKPDADYDALLAMDGAYTPQMKANADKIIADAAAAERAKRELAGNLPKEARRKGDAVDGLRLSKIEENVIPLEIVGGRRAR